MDWNSFSKTLAASPLPWLSNREVTSSASQTQNASLSPVPRPNIIFTRILSYRNFSGFPFFVSASPNLCSAIADKSIQFLSRQGKYQIHRLVDFPPATIRLLRERYLLPPRSYSLAGKKDAKFLALDPLAQNFVWVNEIEHLTFASLHPGLLSEKLFLQNFSNGSYSNFSQALLSNPSSNPSGNFSDLHSPDSPFSYSPEYGYLTSDPHHLGLAPAIELLVHLPALALSKKLLQARNMVMALGLGFFPIGSEGGGEAEAGLFLIRSAGGAGKSAEKVYADFMKTVQALLDWEDQVRIKAQEKYPKKLELRINWAQDKLATATILGFQEMLAYSSWLRLGVYLGLLAPDFTRFAEEWRITLASGHLAFSPDSGNSDLGEILPQEEEDKRRAKVVRLSMDGNKKLGF